MITKTFDNGWGQDYPLKQFEQHILHKLLEPLNQSPLRSVIINSVWYTEQFDHSVKAWLRNNDWHQLVLVAMIDAAIPYPSHYAEFDRPVMALGYYEGKHHLDFWALFVHKFMRHMDIEVLLDHHAMHIPYMCLNRKPHWHRRRLYQQLEHRALVDRGLVSMGSDTGAPIRLLDQDCEHDDFAPNASRDHFGVPNDIASLGHLHNWQQCFLNVVTETCWNINSTGFVSEKIYKPIVGCRPFLVYDPDGATAWLQARGFETFVNDFRDICDLDLTVADNIAPFLEQLVKQPKTYFQHKFLACKEKILYNKQNFTTHVRQQYHTINEGIACPI